MGKFEKQNWDLRSEIEWWKIKNLGGRDYEFPQNENHKLKIWNSKFKGKIMVYENWDA